MRIFRSSNIMKTLSKSLTSQFKNEKSEIIFILYYIQQFQVWSSEIKKSTDGLFQGPKSAKPLGCTLKRVDPEVLTIAGIKSCATAQGKRGK